MRSLVSFSILTVCAAALLLVGGAGVSSQRLSARLLSLCCDSSVRDHDLRSYAGPTSTSLTSIELLLDIEAYEDADYGFSMAIPAGWRRIITANAPDTAETQSEAIASLQSGSDSELNSLWLEPGYAVGFESAQQHADDQFADYILVEILPGKASGLFAADADLRQHVTIDGRPASYDRLVIEKTSAGLTDVDLVIYQAELSGVGYTVGLYSIGERSSERIMAVAFEVMLQTFRTERAPFSIS